MTRLLLALLAPFLLSLAAPGAPAAAGAPPVEPRWVAARLSGDGRGVGLRWNITAGATAYEIHRRSGTGEYRLLATVQGIQHLDEAVEPGVEYAYRVRGVGEGGPGPFSEERVVLLPPPAATAAELFAPRWWRSSIEQVEWGDREPTYRVVLRWLPVDGAVGYRLSRRSADGGAPESLGSFTGLEAEDAAVEPGRVYLYSLSALDPGLEDSPRSLELRIEVGPATAARAVPGDAGYFPAQLEWETASAGPRQAALTEPVDIAFDSRRDRVYVSSAHHRHVVVLGGADGLPAGTIGPTLGKHELQLPLGVGVSPAGDLVVVDQAAAALYLVAPDGRLRRRVPVAAAKGAKPPRLIDAAFHGDGRIFVTDAANRKVLVLAADGRPLASWGRIGPRAEDFSAIGAIEVAADGTVAVADAGAGQIKLFTAQGKFLKALGVRADGDRGVPFLGGFAAEGAGSFLAADLGQSALKRVGPGGTQALPVGRGAAVFRLVGPVGVAGGGAGRFFLAEGIANRVVCIRMTPRRAAP